MKFSRAALLRAAAGIYALCILSACGIDEYIYLEPVSNIVNNPTDTDVASYKYYSFITKDADNSSNASGYFKGWEIYYRIYNSKSDRSADTTAIASKVDTDPANAFNFVSTTKKYRRMTTIHGTDTTALYSAPLLGISSSNRSIFIRPLPFGDEYPAEFTADGTPVSNSEGPALVWRSVSDVQAKTFEFADIAADDADVQYNSASGTEEWYLQAYVFAYGFNSTFKVIYSEPVSLGSISITQ